MPIPQEMTSSLNMVIALAIFGLCALGLIGGYLYHMYLKRRKEEEMLRARGGHHRGSEGSIFAVPDHDELPPDHKLSMNMDRRLSQYWTAKMPTNQLASS